MKAVKALLRTGQVDKIIKFASNRMFLIVVGAAGGREKEVFILAANFLQTTSWQDSQDSVKAIVSFYTKVIMKTTR